MVLVHPRIPPKSLKMLLSKSNSSTQLDVIFESDKAASDMLGALRQSFPNGQHWVHPLGTAAVRDALVCQILCGEDPQPEPEPLMPLDFELYNEMGLSCPLHTLLICCFGHCHAGESLWCRMFLLV